MAGFRYIKSRAGTTDVARKKLQIAASATVAKNDALEFVDGKLKRVNAATDSPKYIAGEDATATATSITKIHVIDCAESMSLFEVDFTPLINGTACNSNSTATQVVVALTDGTTDDLKGGLVYIPELNETRIITGNTYSSNVVTITVAEAFSTAPTTTHTCRVVPFGFGTTALKLHASNMHNAISSAIADITGGKVSIYDVDMEKKVATVFFV